MSDAASLRPRFLRAALSARGVVWLAFYAAILGAWVAVALMAQAQPGSGASGLPADIWASLCLAAGEASFAALVAMWALMAMAMMLPTFVPALRTFDDLRHAGAATAGAMAALVGGYLLVWGGAAFAGAGLQWALSRAGFLTPAGVSLSPWLTFALLLGAGLYQFSTLKDACLSRCRMPMTFFMERWQPGPIAALRMGLSLGASCLGCCWALMLLAFVGGTMNLYWMGLATLFMAFEKLPQIGRYLTRPMGLALIAAAPLSLFF